MKSLTKSWCIRPVTNASWTVKHITVITSFIPVSNMEPIDDYRKSLQILRQIFRLTFQNIFEEHYRYGLGFYITVSVWIFGMSCQLSTSLDSSHYNLALRLTCFGLLFGGLQVRNRLFYIPSKDNQRWLC